MLRLVQHMSRVEQRFGRNAPNIQAGATKRVAAFHDGCLQTELGTANCGHVAAWACTDNDDVVASHGMSP